MIYVCKNPLGGRGGGFHFLAHGLKSLKIFKLKSGSSKYKSDRTCDGGHSWLYFFKVVNECYRFQIARVNLASGFIDNRPESLEFSFLLFRILQVQK